MRLVFDIEADGLLDGATTIWCIVCKDIDTGATYSTFKDYLDNQDGMYHKSASSMSDILRLLTEAKEIIGHNIIGYDIPLLDKLIGWKPSKGTKITDTLVMSRLLNPDRSSPIGIKGGHSLDAWGKRLGKRKPKHEDWTKFSKEMLHRCTEDVEINHLVLDQLTLEASDHDWTSSLKLEHDVASIIAKQARSGVYFDIGAATTLLTDLDNKLSKIDEALLLSLPKTVVRGTTIAKPFNVTGKHSMRVQSWYEDEGYEVVAGPFSKVGFTEFNLNSDKKIKEFLLEEGWVPTEWNYVKDKEQATGYRRTSPKLTEDSFDSIQGGMPASIKERLLIKHRRSCLKSLKNDKKGLLNNIRPDGTIPADANPCGTNTGRMTHMTVVNIPRAGTLYGKEMRSLFIPRPGRIFVGHDAKGIELRMLAHYIDDYLYTQEILTGDIHNYNQGLAGLPTRDDAKTFIYAFIYGAGDQKLGSIIGGTKRDGTDIRNKFLTANPRLEQLINSTKRESGKGYLLGLDGRKVWMRRGDDGRIMRHKALNTRLQSGGAVVMKKSIVLLDQWVREENLDSIKVIDMHDEGQYDVAPKDVERHKELAEKSIVEAGKYYNLNIPLAADVKSGSSWYETH